MEVLLELCQPFLFLAQTVDHGGRQIDSGEQSHCRSIRFEGAVSVARLADIVGYQSDCYGVGQNHSGICQPQPSIA